MTLGLLKGRVPKLIKDGAYRKYFMHRTGHWLGLDVHDVGDYKVGERVARAGTRHGDDGGSPGIYIPAGMRGVPKRFWNCGIRIEDDVLVTATGCGGTHRRRAQPSRRDRGRHGHGLMP